MFNSPSLFFIFCSIVNIRRKYYAYIEPQVRRPYSLSCCIFYPICCAVWVIFYFILLVASITHLTYTHFTHTYEWDPIPGPECNLGSERLLVIVTSDLLSIWVSREPRLECDRFVDARPQDLLPIGGHIPKWYLALETFGEEVLVPPMQVFTS